VRQEARGRDADGKLREILAWGIPAPGGRGAPRGLPNSYLITALLGRQDGVEAILKASLEEDGVDTGHTLVTKALRAVGQDPRVSDPRVSQMLQRLEGRVQEAFTAGGRPKKGGPLDRAAQEITHRERRVKELEERVTRSTEIESRVQSLTERRNLATDERSRLQRRVELLRRVRQTEDEVERVRVSERSVEEPEPPAS
jgi:hypothetical protein